MPLYHCAVCNFKTKLKTDYNRHLKTKKHKNNVELSEMTLEGYVKSLKNEHKMNKMNTNEHKNLQNTHIFEPMKICVKSTLQDQPIIIHEDNNGTNKFHCIYCNKEFASKPSKRRHELHYCQYNPALVKNKDEEERLKTHEKEKRELYKQIEKLLEENGKIIQNYTNNSNNTINNIHQTNNIIIKNYGEEDLSHITSNVLDKLIESPADMINNLTKMIHFNKDKPENMNMYIPSRKQRFIKVFRENKWVLEEKKRRIPDLIDRNYIMLDNHYEDCGGNERISNEAKRHYQNYQNFIDRKNKQIMNQEYIACELAILNNSSEVMNFHNLNN